MQPAARPGARLSFVIVTALSLITLHIDSHAGQNTRPRIKGDPPTRAVADERYRFRPRAFDRDGDRLRFRVANLPSWASFDAKTGKIAGTPRGKDAGLYSNIRIRVTDGKSAANLAPFSIRVVNKSNSSPVISGDPSDEAVTGTRYRFRPKATDRDGDTLRFRVVNLPSWANFDKATGQIAGTPKPADVGIYKDIRIVVSDGENTARLKPFSVAVIETTRGAATLSWNAPSENVDGSNLTDLTGYRIYYGRESGNYDLIHDVANPGLETTMIGNLTSGTWYFAAVAVNSSGEESGMSNEVRHEVK